MMKMVHALMLCAAACATPAMAAREAVKIGFTADQFFSLPGNTLLAGQSPISGSFTMSYDPADTSARDFSVNSVSLTIAGHAYKAAELTFATFVRDGYRTFLVGSEGSAGAASAFALAASQMPGSDTTFGYARPGESSYAFAKPAVSISVSAVPEPASWALMIGGFGLVGGMARRRRAVLAVGTDGRRTVSA